MNQETTKTGNMFLVGRDRRARCSGVSATQPKRDQNGSGTLRTPEAPTARADRAGREASAVTARFSAVLTGGASWATGQFLFAFCLVVGQAPRLPAARGRLSLCKGRGGG
jgi:hypothetical protein